MTMKLDPRMIHGPKNTQTDSLAEYLKYLENRINKLESDFVEHILLKQELEKKSE